MFSFTSVVGFSKQNLCECVCVYTEKERDLLWGPGSHEAEKSSHLQAGDPGNLGVYFNLNPKAG